MANQYLDNFSLSANLADYAKLAVYTPVGQTYFQIAENSVIGRPMMTAASGEAGSGVYFCPINLSAKDVFIGFRVIFASEDTGQIIRFLGVGNLRNCAVGWNADSSLSIYNAAGTQVARSSPGALIGNVPTYMEVGIVTDPSVGSVQVKVQGTLVAQASNINTDGAGDGVTIGIGCVQAEVGWSITDVYMNDSSGSTWNTFMGDIEVQTILPTAASVSQLTPVGNSQNYENAAQVSPNISDYNWTTTVGNKDVYVGNELASDTNAVLMVVQRTMAYTTPGGTHTFEQLIVSEGSTTTSSPHTMTVANGAYEDRYYVNPTTGAAWTIADVNAIQFGDQLAA